ncbi:MAG: type III-B CRISPR module RAMP protein Cmr6 [Campylobacteraceae bacterium]|jgi:CRISPR-associated protein Cmr6|nr:type III-B CRISPR module RAMP protein Cmr6 [Campylobacteraceae bacterium]
MLVIKKRVDRPSDNKQGFEDWRDSKANNQPRSDRDKQSFNEKCGGYKSYNHDKQKGGGGDRNGAQRGGGGDSHGGNKYGGGGDRENSRGFIPLPNKTVNHLEKESANFSLSFVRLMQWSVVNSEDIKKPTEAIDKLYKKANSQIKQADAELVAIHKRQSEAVNSFGALPIEIKAKLISPFISGLGAGHPNETGMILDRNTGCPFLPASSIKGVLRLAYALKLAEEDPTLVDKDGNIKDKNLEKYFGSTDTHNSKRGQLVILDAYPLKAPKIKLDIMNPHYGKYYNKERKLPTETDNPIPIKFISVEKGAEFAFRAFFLPFAASNFNESDKKAIESAFDKAFKVIGFGGKTAIGYGRFEIKQ